MIALSEDLRVGHPTIDDDHQALIDIINRFLAQAQSMAKPELMHKTLKALLAYGQEHFSREEQIQKECMYPYADMHREEHRCLIVQVKDMAKTYFIDKRLSIDSAAVARMETFLRGWLVSHIRDFDTNMREWIVPARQDDGAPPSRHP
jgi:hemerythrin